MSDYQPPRLMPMNIADILDAAVRLYRRNFRAFFGITAIVLVPMGVFQTLIAYMMGRMTETMPENPDAPPVQQLLMMGMAYGGLILINMIAVPISQGALSVAVSRRYLNYSATVADAYGAIGVRWGPLIATVLLASMVSVAGMVLCVAPGVYLTVMWLFITPVIAIEGLGGIQAMKRSWDLVSGEWWRCFSTYFLLNLLVGLIAGMVAWPVTMGVMVLMADKNMALAQAISTGTSMACTVILQPVAITGIVLLYYDLRIRKEGFDLQLLARAMKVPESEMPTYESYVKAEPLPGQQMATGASTIPTELWEYVWQARTSGMTYEQAREQLLAGGWPQAQIDQHLPGAWSAAQAAVAAAEPEPLPPVQEPPNPFSPEAPPPDQPAV